ncbi:MAG: tetratricopeptide repeat protein [Candidatus Thermoplasmatota archaeon]
MSTKERDIFVDREEEMKKLMKALKEVKKGRCRSIFIEGEAGIGKTRLVSEFKHHARKEGFDFFLGTSNVEASDPYHPFKEAFKEYIEKSRSPSEGKPMAFLGKGAEESEDEEEMFSSKKEANFHYSTKRIKNIASQNPFVVFLDDIHWADKATIDIFSYMSNKIESEPVLFIAAYCPTEVSTDDPLENLLRRAIRKKPYKKIDLGPLEKEHTGEIVRDTIKREDVPEDFINFIHNKTEGNPLFVKEMVKEMREEGTIDLKNHVYPSQGDDITVPDVILSVIESRLDQLSPETKRILQIGSVIGNRVPFPLLVELSDADEFKILDQIDILVDYNLWYEEPGEEVFHFSHGLVRDAVLEDMKNLKRKRWHEKVADRLKQDESINLGEKYSKLAYHYREAEEYPKSIEYYVEAAERARDRYAYEDSIDFYESGINLIENADSDFLKERKKILEKLADLFKLTGRYDRSKEIFEELYEDPLDKAQQQILYRKLAAVFLEMGDLDRALEYVEEGLNQVESSIKERCRLLELKGWVSMEKQMHSKALDIFREERNLANLNRQSEVLGEAINELGSVVLPLSETENSIEYLIEEIKSRDEEGEDQRIPESLVKLREDMGEERVLEKALNFYERCANLRKNKDGNEDFGMPFDNLGVIYKTSGDILDQALHYYGKSLSICRDLGDEKGISVIYYHMGLINQKKGHLDRAIKCYENSLKSIKDRKESDHLLSVLERLGEVHREKGDLEKALKYHDKALNLVNYGDGRFSIECEMILDSIELGRLDDAVSRASDVWRKAQRDGTTESLIKSRRVGGRAYLKKGNLSEAKNKLEDALNMCVGGKNDVSKAKTLYEMGLLKKRKDDKEGEEELKKACKIFSDRRMKIWEEKCKDKLKNDYST